MKMIQHRSRGEYDGEVTSAYPSVAEIVLCRGKRRLGSGRDISDLFELECFMCPSFG